jgi:hypothetical protein
MNILSGNEVERFLVTILIDQLFRNITSFRDWQVKPFFKSSHQRFRVESSRVESSEDIFAVFLFSVYFYKER